MIENLYIYTGIYLLIGVSISIFVIKYIIKEVKSKGLEYHIENKLIAVAFIFLSVIWPLLICSIIFVYVREYYKRVSNYVS